MAGIEKYQPYIERKASYRQQYLGSHREEKKNERETAVNEVHKNDKIAAREKRRYEFIRKKRRKRIMRRIVLCFLMLMAVLIGNFTARIEIRVNEVLNHIDRSNIVDLDDVALEDNFLSTDKKIINILLVGSDKRESWKEKGRSDSSMIATLDLKNKKLKLTSLMRDMYVDIPEYDKNRFNAAYSFGGIELLYQTIGVNFEIKLDGYVIVDFEAFKSVINTIGGVEITLTEAEHTYLTTAYKKGSVLKLKQGVNNMNGVQALAYTRIRQDAKGDFGRTERQRKVLQAVFRKIKTMSLSRILEVAEEIMPYIATDLTNEEIFSYIKSIIMLGTTDIDQMRIPVDDSYIQDRINNMAVLIPDIELNKKALNKFIFEN